MPSVQEQVAQARDYLQRHPNLSQLHDETGLGYWWLARLKNEGTQSPRADKLDALLTYMKQNPLPNGNGAKTGS